MNTKFQALMLEGTFYLSDNKYFPDSKGVVREGAIPALMFKPFQGGARSFYDDLMVLEGRRIRLVVQHLPPMPPDMSKWGGGCCLWETVGRCPFGHHEEPFKILNLPAEGVLNYDANHELGSGGWWVDKLDGSRIMLPFAHFLPGHVARVAGATVMDVDKIREVLSATGGLGAVEDLGERITDLRDMVSRIKKGDT